MRQLHKLYLSAALLAGLGWMPALLAETLQLAQTTAIENHTPGGDTREMTSIEQGAREENERARDMSKSSRDPESTNRADFNDQDEGGFDRTLVLSLLMLGLAGLVLLLVANRRRRPVDSIETRP